MGIPLDVFSLYRLHNEGAHCHHYLLLKVEQPAFSNADEGEYDNVVEVADRKRSNLIEVYEAEILADQCGGPHEVALLGELQASPTGDDLFEESAGREVDLWITETGYGHPWVVMGTAASEEAFWVAVEEDEDLWCLGAVKPARNQRVYFLTEKGMTYVKRE